VLGRLGAEPDTSVAALCGSATRTREDAWLRPITASLRGRGGADVLSLPGGWRSTIAFTHHIGRRSVAHGDIYDGFSLWDLERGERTAQVLPRDEMGGRVEHTACGQVGDTFLVVTDDGEGSTVQAWTADNPSPLWRSAPWIEDTVEDPLVQLRALAVGGDSADAVVAVGVWHRQDRRDRVWLLDPWTGGSRRTIGYGGFDRLTLGSAGGRTLLSARTREGEGVWDCSSGALLRTIAATERPTASPSVVALGPIGDRWAIAVADAPLDLGRQHRLVVWDGPTGDPIAEVDLGPGGDVMGMRFADDGSGLLAIGRADWLAEKGLVRVLDVRTATDLVIVPVATKQTADVALGTGSGPRLLGVATDDSVRVWDLDRLVAGEDAASDHRAEVTAVSFGDVPVSGDRDGVVQTWSSDGSVSERHTLPGAVLGLAWCRCEGLPALAAGTASELTIVDPASGGPVRRIPLRGTVVERALAAVESDARWYVAVETSRLVQPDEIDPGDPDADLGQPVNVHQVQVFDVATGTQTYELSHSTTPLAIRVGDAGGFVVLGRYGGGSIVEAASGRPLPAPAGGADPAHTAAKIQAVRHALGERGTNLGEVRGELAAPLGPGTGIVAVSSGRELRVWDLDGPRSLAAFSADEPITCFAVDARGGRLIVGDRSGAVHHLEIMRRD